MKWTAEGKKIGDTIAWRTYGGEIRMVKIDGETPTLWKIDRMRVRKSDGSVPGETQLRAFDADADACATIQEQECERLASERFFQIEEFIRKSRRSNSTRAMVADLLWDIVSPHIERDETE